MKSTNAIPVRLIAPCGMNCRLCRAYGRQRKPCPGCRGDDDLKSRACVTCRIRNCEVIASGAGYCFDCEGFPCATLKHLDKRYRTRYGMSMIDNLEHIEKHGVRDFIRSEKERWACSTCGRLICVHKPKCPYCGYKRTE